MDNPRIIDTADANSPPDCLRIVASRIRVRPQRCVLMATNLIVSCPDCKKQYKAPPGAEGKKIRCKACGQTFRVEASPAATKAASKAGLPKSALSPSVDQIDLTPYQVTDQDMTARCPHCAKEMDSEDAVICIHCGYDVRVRQQLKTKRIIELDAADRFRWLLPGLISIAVVLMMLGTVAFLWLGLPYLASKNASSWWAFFDHKMTRVWGTVACLFVIYFAGRLAIDRLILHPSPPENVVR